MFLVANQTIRRGSTFLSIFVFLYFTFSKNKKVDENDGPNFELQEKGNNNSSDCSQSYPV